MQRMDCEEQRRDCRHPPPASEQQHKPRHQCRIQQVESEIFKVIQERMQSHKQVIKLIADQREGDVELRIVTGECLFDGCRREGVDDGVLHDEQLVIPVHKSEPERTPVDKEQQNPQEPESRESLLLRWDECFWHELHCTAITFYRSCHTSILQML